MLYSIIALFVSTAVFIRLILNARAAATVEAKQVSQNHINRQ